MSDNNRFKTQREKNVLDDTKLKLFTDALPNGEGKPSFCLYVAGNNPRIDVYTNLPGDKDNGNIRAEIDIVIAMEILQIIEDYANGREENPQITWENSGKTWDRANNKPSKDMMVKSKIVVGKDKEGRIYIAVLSADPDRPKIKFHFGVNMFRKVYVGNNEKASDAMVSRMTALAWVSMQRVLVPTILANTYVYKTKADQQQGNQRGGGNYNRGNSGGGNNRNYGGGSDNDLSDDLGF